MRKTETRTIDGIEFTITQMAPKRSQALLLRVLGLFSGAVGKALAGITGDPGKPFSLLTADIDFAKIGEALPQLFQRLDGKELDSIQKELLETAQYSKDGKGGMFWPLFDEVIEEPFTGLKLTLFAMEVNYGNFSTALVARVEAMKQGARVSGASSTSKSIGLSGGSSSSE